jgi:DNA polymerase elongation subunit (family B)
MENELSTKMCILDINYFIEDERPVVSILGKTEEGKSVVVFDRRFSPYFYVEPKKDLNRTDLKSLRERVAGLEVEGKKPTRIEEVRKKFLGKETTLFRVEVQIPADLPKFRDLLKEWKEVNNEYEYSISFYRRYLIDNDLYPMCWVEVQGRPLSLDWDFDLAMEAEKITRLDLEEYPKISILSFDIETVFQNDSDKIIMISLRDNNRFEKVLTYKKFTSTKAEILKSEKGMIRRFVEIVRKRNPDMIIGYNTDRFDFAKLDERATKLKVPLKLGRDGSEVRFRRRMRTMSAKIKGRVHIDLYNFVENIMDVSLSTEVLTLDRVAREITGKGKEKLSWSEIEKAWRSGKNIDKVAEYCLTDSRLALSISGSILPQIFELCRIVGQTPFDISRMSYSQLVEWLLIRRAFTSGEVIPKTPIYDEVQKRRMYPPYTGGFVLEPEEGIHSNIALFDFRSLYPSIIITHNISPETLDCMSCEKCRGGHIRNQEPGGEHYYCTSREGFVPGMVKSLVNERNRVRDGMRNLRKESEKYKRLETRQHVLKIMANASYGYYGYPGSRWYSRVCAQSAASWGRFYIKKVIEKARKSKYNPIYGDTDSLFIKMKNKNEAGGFLEKVNRSLPGMIEMDFQGLYKSGIFVSTKTGTGAKKRYALLDYSGNMLIRGFEKVRRDWSEIAKDTQERVLSAVLKDRSQEKALKVVKRAISRLINRKVIKEDLVIYSQITRPLDKYEQIGPHVAAARKALQSGRKIGVGSVISYIITEGEGSISSRAEPSETEEAYDPEYYIKNQVIPAALRILSVFGLTEEDFLEEEETEQSSLIGFLGKKK